jgi:hypothetical protein
LLTFCPGWYWTIMPPISTSRWFSVMLSFTITVRQYFWKGSRLMPHFVFSTLSLEAKTPTSIRTFSCVYSSVLCSALPCYIHQYPSLFILKNESTPSLPSILLHFIFWALLCVCERERERGGGKVKKREGKWEWGREWSAVTSIGLWRIKKIKLCGQYQ